MLQRLLLLVIQFGLATSALAETSNLTGEALRQAVSGRTVLIEAPIGTFLIRYESDSTMTGQAPTLVASLGSEKDQGQWWVADDRLCQPLVPMAGWETILLQATTHRSHRSLAAR